MRPSFKTTTFITAIGMVVLKSYLLLPLVMVVLLISCSKSDTGRSTEQQVAQTDTCQVTTATPVEADESSLPAEETSYAADEEESREGLDFIANITTIMQSIIDGDSKALASVSVFPIWRPYPEKNITNAKDLQTMFPVLFDDSIRNMLKNCSLSDWNQVGWRGYTLKDGRYLWAGDWGHLYMICYESSALKAYRAKLHKQEKQDLHESKEWETTACLLSLDSTLFLRLEEFDGTQRLHLFSHDSMEYLRHLVFNGMRTYEGSCHNAAYWYACSDSVISVWINSPRCLDCEINYGVHFPDSWNLPDSLRGKTIPCKPAFWRDVKKWW